MSDLVKFPLSDVNVPHSASYGVYICQLIHSSRASNHVADLKTPNKLLTQKILKQGYLYHKLHLIFYWPFEGGVSFVDLFCYLCFRFFLYYTIVSVSCSLVITCWERADLLTLLSVLFPCIFVTFPSGVLVKVGYLIVLIPDLWVFSLLLIEYWCTCSIKSWTLWKWSIYRTPVKDDVDSYRCGTKCWRIWYYLYIWWNKYVSIWH